MSAAAVDPPPPLTALPTAKEKKYDRQLRLWAASGQAALEDAHLLLINNGPGVTGVEALKNLVLPGIGQFTIHDSAIVDEADLGVNFFVEQSDVGKPRAECTTRLLQELNPDVVGHSITEPLETWSNNLDHTLTKYTHIMIAAPLARELFSRITHWAASHSIPVVYIHSVGMLSQFSLSLPAEFPIIDTHPDPASISDLRILSPWPELVEFAKSKTDNLEALSPQEFGHVPYVLLLLHFVDKWKDEHNGQLPTSYKDKTQLRDLIRAQSREEENFEEAASAVLKTLNLPTASSAVKDLLGASVLEPFDDTTISFWYIARAAFAFHNKHQQLPLSGTVPDMKAQSKDYVQLQRIYKDKARQDCAEVTATVRSLEEQHGRPDHIPDSEIEAFCKGAAYIKLLNGSIGPVDLATDPIKGWNPSAAKLLVQALGLLVMGDTSALTYIGFLAWDAFTASHDTDNLTQAPRPPGLRDSDVDSDAEKLFGIAKSILDTAITKAETFIEEPEYGQIKEGLQNVCRELTRAGGAELHNIAALTGGMVAQEVIKVITKQYVPVDSVCVFDGVASKAGVLKL